MQHIVLSTDQSCPIYHNEVDSVKIQDIVDRAFKRLATIGITGIYDLLTVDDNSDEPIEGWDVLVDVLKDTLDRFEGWEPFVLKMQVEFNSTGELHFVDNFWEYLDNKVPRRSLMMIPRKIISIFNTFQGTLRGIRYEPPVMYGNLYNGSNIINAICTRPVKICRDGNGFTDDSRIYFLGEIRKPQLKRFRDLFLVNLGKYLIRLNENTQYPNLPIEQFNGLVNFISDLESKTLQDFEISHGYASIYGK